MRASHILVAATLLACATAAPSLSLSVNASTGAFTLSSSTWPALSLSSAPPQLRVNGALTPLALASPPSTFNGADALGPFAGTTLSFAAAAGGAPLLVATLKAYTTRAAVGFAAAFPAAVASNGTEATKDSTAAAFPAFALPATSSLGFMQWAGPFINQGVVGPRTGSFSAAGATSFSSGLASGPIVLLDATGAASLVLSAASEFAAVSVAAEGGALNFGPLGSAAELPAGYAYETIAYLGAGVNEAMMTWGDAMMSKFGKPHGLSKSDFTNTHLIYNTDHGAYYYYNPTPEYVNYTGMLNAVGEYAASVGIPYRGVLLDSWCKFTRPTTRPRATLTRDSIFSSHLIQTGYFKGTGGGVKNWTAMPTIFDGGNAGIRALVDKFGWKVTAHNRWWSANTDYARQNGGDFDFFIDSGKGVMAVPLSSEFWTWLLTQSVDEWGLTTYGT